MYLFLLGDDTKANVERLCHKAANPVRHDLIKGLGMENAGIKCGAVCVYPAQVSNAVNLLNKIGAKDIPVAAGK